MIKFWGWGQIFCNSLYLILKMTQEILKLKIHQAPYEPAASLSTRSYGYVVVKSDILRVWGPDPSWSLRISLIVNKTWLPIYYLYMHWHTAWDLAILSFYFWNQICLFWASYREQYVIKVEGQWMMKIQLNTICILSKPSLWQFKEIMWQAL